MLRFLIGLSLLLLSGCGKYMRPLPPEVVSPSGVQELTASATLEGVKLAWRSPTTDLRGKDLKSLQGYSIERKVVLPKADKDAEQIETEFEQVSFVEDHSVEKLLEAQEAARAAGTPSHRAKVDEEFKKFEFTDSGVTAGTRYLYKIVPQNNNGEGASPKMVRVLFRGDSSEVSVIDSGELEDDLLEDPFA